MTTRRTWRPLWLAILVLGCACQSKERCAPEAERPVNEALVAFLSRTRAAHHLADQAERDGNLKLALSRLDSVTQGPLPTPEKLAPETHEVLADTWARIAHLHSELGAFDAAERALGLGLKHAPSASYFEGYLFELRGLNEERRAKQLAAQNHLQPAAAASGRAVTAFERAMRIQGAVIERERKKTPDH